MRVIPRIWSSGNLHTPSIQWLSCLSMINQGTSSCHQATKQVIHLQANGPAQYCVMFNVCSRRFIYIYIYIYVYVWKGRGVWKWRAVELKKSFMNKKFYLSLMQKRTSMWRYFGKLRCSMTETDWVSPQKDPQPPHIHKGTVELSGPCSGLQSFSENYPQIVNASM